MSELPRQPGRARLQLPPVRPGSPGWTIVVLVVGGIGLVLLRAAGATGASIGWAVLVIAAAQLPLLRPPPAVAPARSRPDRSPPVPVDPATRAEQRARARACAVAGAVWAVLLLPVLWRVAHGPITGYLFSDWDHHLRLVPRFQLDPVRVPIPHFLFELSTRSVLEATSLSLETAGTFVATAFTAATGATLAWFFQRPWVEGGRRPSPWLGAACSIAFVLAELPQFTFFKATALRDDLINASIHQWNTPSTVTAESFQILLLVGAVTALTVRRPVERTARWVAPLAVVAMVAKPSVPLVIGAAVVPWLLRSRAPGWAWRRGILAISAPVFVTAAAQLYIGANWWESDQEAGLALRAGGVLRNLDFWGPGLAVAVLPALALLVGGRALVRHPAARLAGWSLLAGIVATSTVVETGLRAADGNVARTAFAGYWLLYLCLLRFVLDVWLHRDEWAGWSTRRRAGVALLGAYVVLSLVAGTGLYLEEVGLMTFTGATG